MKSMDKTITAVRWADYPDEEELKAMAKIRGCSVMELLIEEARRDIAAGRGYPMPFE